MIKSKKIIKKKIKYLYDDLRILYNIGNSIIEFCTIPFDDEIIKISKSEKIKLKSIIKRINFIQNELLRLKIF